MANETIRELMKSNNIPQWKLADKLGFCEATVQRMLRKELPEAEQKKIINIINELKGIKNEY